MRQLRKIQHVELAQQLSEQANAGFQDITLLPCAIPELTLHDINTNCRFLGKLLSAPIMINAMTGGHPELRKINQALARTAKQAGFAMAVGSQRAALEKKEISDTFAVAREENPEGIIIANLNAGCEQDEAVMAVDMLAADALQLHLNASQEVAMAEGDLDFRGILRKIEKVKKSSSVPVIVKEVGFGISKEVVGQLREIGVDYVDVGGRGGTNFIAIERLRGGSRLPEEMLSWGIPTVSAVIEATVNFPGHVIASGGIRTALDVAKSVAIGAVMVGIARPFLVAYSRGPEAIIELAIGLKNNLQAIMLLAGAGDIAALRTKPVVVTGFTREWLHERGVDTTLLSQRKVSKR